MALAHGESVIEVAWNLLEPEKVGGDRVQLEVERLSKEEGMRVGKGYFTDFSQEKLIQSYLQSDHHGPPRVNVWQDPLSPSKWKEEHFVIVSLSGWGLLIFWGYKFFTGGKGKKEEQLAEASH
ncbi:uncharacterized protein Pyn_38713 [Prunus yedoensis var. nudiflora]|uniref:Uncharacterized protein n=1 Tax=Prunus yedoensis var. nudiflora TaxID=2094558 RepID=A0A314Z7H7_PRUYE|nr:uncharacterized protein Pyn_38713 [Prunus yedoensis var. nudiflora]